MYKKKREENIYDKDAVAQGSIEDGRSTNDEALFSLAEWDKTGTQQFFP